MPQQTIVKSSTPTLRIFLVLSIVWSVLQCALIFSIYKFHLSDPSTYLLALLSLSPVIAMITLAARRRASELDTYLRSFYLGTIIFATLFLAVTPLLLLLANNFQARGRFTLGGAASVAAMPTLLGVFFSVVLLVPRMTEGTLLDQVSPLQVKLVTPSLRRLFRTGALALVYVNASFASHVIFADCRLTGILAYAVALLPVLPIFGLIYVYKKYTSEEEDEFQRHLFYQSVLWAFFGTVVLASVIGRLQDYALLFPSRPHFFRPYWVVPLFCFLQIEAGYVVTLIQGVRVNKQEKQEKKDR